MMAKPKLHGVQMTQGQCCQHSLIYIIDYSMHIFYTATTLSEKLITVLPEIRTGIWMHLVRWQVHHAERACNAFFNTIR